MVVGECCRGKRGAETAIAGCAAEGSTEQANGLEGEQASLAGLRVQQDWAGSKIFGGDRSK